MKASDMTNEALASFFEKNSTTILKCTRCGDETPISDFFASRFREAAARLRRPTPVDDDLLKMARDIEAKDAEIAKLRTLLASTVGYTCILCGMKSSKMCGTCAVFKAQEILEGGNDEKH